MITVSFKQLYEEDIPKRDRFESYCESHKPEHYSWDAMPNEFYYSFMEWLKLHPEHNTMSNPLKAAGEVTDIVWSTCAWVYAPAYGTFGNVMTCCEEVRLAIAAFMSEQDRFWTNYPEGEPNDTL